MTTFTYTKPTVGGSEDTWGDTLNANWDAIAAFIGPLDSTELAVLDGITASTAELNLLHNVTASTAELNLLDGVPLTTDLSYVDGVTSAIQDQIDNIPAPPELTQVQVEDDTSTVFGQVSGQRLAQAVAINAPADQGFTESFGGTGSEGYTVFPNGLIMQWGRTGTLSGDTTITLPIAFPNAHITGVASPSQSGALTGNVSAYYVVLSLTQCRITHDASGNSDSSPVGWIAIGY